MAEDRKMFSSSHEAGHAVIATVLHVPVEYTTIGEAPKYLGMTVYTKDWFDEDNNYKELRIIAALAGGFASLRYDSSRFTSWDDWERASEIAIHIVGKEKKMHYLMSAERRASKEVIKYKKYIEAVTRELSFNGKLNGGDIEEIIYRKAS